MRTVFAIIAGLMLIVTTASMAVAGEASTGDMLVDVLHNKGVLDDAQYNELKKAKAEGGEQAAQRKLLDTLHDKGVLDDAQYKRLSEQADQEAAKAAAAPAAAAAPQAPSVPQAPASSQAAVAGGPERPFDKTLTSLEEGFARLGGDTVKLKLGAFIQAGWLNDDAGFSYGAPPNNFFSPHSDNQFFVRRGRLFFDFGVGPKVGMKISLEGAADLQTSTTTSGGRSILRDAYFWTDYVPYTRITVGQFKTPFGLEGVEALGDNPTINRSMVTNLVHYPLLRDIGAMASWRFRTDVSGLPLGAAWSVAVVNGTGYNVPDDNNRKDVVFRGTVTPLLEGLNVGGSLYHGQTHVVPTAGATFNKDHDSWAAEAEYLPPFLKGLKLRYEYLWNRQFYTKYYSLASVTGTALNTAPATETSIGVPAPAGTTLTFTAPSRTVHTDGWYVLAAYRVDGLQGFGSLFNGFEPLVRYEEMNEDGIPWIFTSTFKNGAGATVSTVHTTVSNHWRYRTTIGLNYYFNKYARLMMNYEMIHADGGLRFASIEPIDLISHELFTTIFQIKF